MSKIYTKSGDKGFTCYDGVTRVKKDHPVIAALGEVDELNSLIGVLKSYIDHQPQLLEFLCLIQQKLLALGSELSLNIKAFSPKDSTRLELEIDRMDKKLPPLREFILPGGSRPAAFSHLCRAVCRRMERRITSLPGAENDTLKFINRLADYFFVLARSLD